MTGNNETLKQGGAMYDEWYYEHGCGDPYARTEKVLAFFDGIAERLVRGVAPKSVLDAGCALGMLVEKLRDRGVEAFGRDISEFAIANVREDIRPFCEVGSVLDPFPRRYDLIVCMEVVEHLPREEASAVIENLCRHSDEVILTSSPLDFREATHFNVQPPEYWASLFAQQGFTRDFSLDVSFIMPWAMRFRKREEPLYVTVQNYERELWQAKQQVHGLREMVEAGRETQKQLEETRAAWKEAGAEFTRIAEHLTGERDHFQSEASRLVGEVQRLEEEKKQLEAEMTAIRGSRAFKLASLYWGGKR